jgi:hypothetical protein
MKKILSLALLGYGIWFGVIGGKRIDEKHVHNLYRHAAIALTNNDGDAYCSLFADDVQVTIEVKMPGFPTTKETMGKEKICGALDRFYETKEKMEQTTGIELFINHEYKIISISISPDRKVATVEVDDEIRIGTERGAWLTMRTTQTDRIRRSFGFFRAIKA